MNTKKPESDFDVVTEYLETTRPFYAMDSDDNPKVTKRLDLLYKGLKSRQEDQESIVIKAR